MPAPIWLRSSSGWSSRSSHSRHPLWEDRLDQPEDDRSHIGAGMVLDHGKEALGTTPLDAEPNVILKMPHDTLVPLALGLAMTLVAIGLVLVNWWVVAIGGLFTAAA